MDPVSRPLAPGFRYSENQMIYNRNMLPAEQKTDQFSRIESEAVDKTRCISSMASRRHVSVMFPLVPMSTEARKKSAPCIKNAFLRCLWPACRSSIWLNIWMCVSGTYGNCHLTGNGQHDKPDIQDLPVVCLDYQARHKPTTVLDDSGTSHPIPNITVP